MRGRRSRIGGAAAAIAVAALAPCVPAAAAAPRVTQLVVFRDGSARQKTVAARQVRVRVGHRRCAVGAATPLAALVRSRIGALSLKDYGSCSRHAADAGQLYVRAIRGERAGGLNGWVYKAGTKLASNGAGDLSGPYGHGRLRAGARVEWFYCRMSARGCQPTLSASSQALGGGSLRVTVRAYDDNGHASAASGATVHAGAATATTGADGSTTFSGIAPGRVAVFAEKAGAVRSFEEAVDVR